MSQVFLKRITYGQLREGNWLTDKDNYGLAAFVDDNVVQTFLDCPNTDDDTKTALQIAIDDGVIVGRRLFYSTRIKVGDRIIKAQATGSAVVQKEYRGRGIGSQMRDYTLTNEEYEIWLFSLLSPQCLAIMRKPENGCVIFDFSQFVRIVNTEAAFACRGFKGVVLRLFTSLGNAVVRCMDIPYRIKLLSLKKRYKLEKKDHVPPWAGDMCINDTHKYAEYHDVAWLEWNLTHNLSGEALDRQSFYAIYDNCNNPIGFFFIKERLRRDVKNCENMLCGTLCEWASNNKQLKEIDINLLALSTFSLNCYKVITITDSSKTERALRRFGFFRQGCMQMGFKDKKCLFPDMSDRAKWRIRYGCCNSILFTND